MTNYNLDPVKGGTMSNGAQGPLANSIKYSLLFIKSGFLPPRHSFYITIALKMITQFKNTNSIINWCY